MGERWAFARTYTRVAYDVIDYCGLVIFLLAAFILTVNMDSTLQHALSLLMLVLAPG